MSEILLEIVFCKISFGKTVADRGTAINNLRELSNRRFAISRWQRTGSARRRPLSSSFDEFWPFG